MGLIYVLFYSKTPNGEVFLLFYHLMFYSYMAFPLYLFVLLHDSLYLSPCPFRKSDPASLLMLFSYLHLISPRLVCCWCFISLRYKQITKKDIKSATLKNPRSRDLSTASAGCLRWCESITREGLWDVTQLLFSKASDTGPQNILGCKLDRDGLSAWTGYW